MIILGQSNSLCEKRYGLLDSSDESCTIGTFTGQCNVRDTRQGIHFTAYNDVYGISVESDWTVDETTYSAIGADWYESDSVFFDDYYIDYGTLGLDDEAGRLWENITVEVSESSRPSSMTVGPIFTITSENWEDWSWVDLNDNGSRTEDSGSEYWMEDTSYEGMQELSIEFEGYNEADSLVHLQRHFLFYKLNLETSLMEESLLICYYSLSGVVLQDSTTMLKMLQI